MKQTIAQQLNITEFPFKIKDKNGKIIYWEDSKGHWVKYEYDSNGNKIYCEYSNGYCEKLEYDSNKKLIYWENSEGYIRDNRPKKEVKLTLEDIAKAFNVDVKQINIIDKTN